jgi:FkbM family methyltransferase
MNDGDITLPRYHEAPILEIFQKHFYNGFVDVGSHVGTWIRALQGQSSLVVGIEPQRELREECLKHCMKHVILLPVAVDNRNGFREMNLFGHGGHGSFMENGVSEIVGPMVEKRIVQTIKLDLLCSMITHCDLLKIDVEGMECNVIEGGMKFLEKFNPMCVIECHSKTSHERIKNTFEVVLDFGYGDCEYIVGKYSPHTGFPDTDKPDTDNPDAVSRFDSMDMGL